MSSLPFCCYFSYPVGILVCVSFYLNRHPTLPSHLGLISCPNLALRTVYVSFSFTLRQDKSVMSTFVATFTTPLAFPPSFPFPFPSPTPSCQNRSVNFCCYVNYSVSDSATFPFPFPSPTPSWQKRSVNFCRCVYYSVSVSAFISFPITFTRPVMTKTLCRRLSLRLLPPLASLPTYLFALPSPTLRHDKKVMQPFVTTFSSLPTFPFPLPSPTLRMTKALCHLKSLRLLPF